MKNIKIHIITCILILLIGSPLFAQYENSNIAVSLNYSFITSSKIYLSPNAQDPILRNQYAEMSGSKSYGIDIRFKISDPLIIGISSEYFKSPDNHTPLPVGGFLIDAIDNFTLIPVELTLYYHIPFSTEKFKFYMGGGAGLYFGRQSRTFSDVTTSDNGSESAYGIHVCTGMEYIANEYISLRAEMKFRDPEFNMKNKYSKQVFEYKGRPLLLPRESFETKANVDGIMFTVGLVFRLL